MLVALNKCEVPTPKLPTLLSHFSISTCNVREHELPIVLGKTDNNSGRRESCGGKDEGAGKDLEDTS